MDRETVFQGLKNAQKLMNDPNFNRKVNSYVNNGAGQDGYMASSPSQKTQSIMEGADPMAYNPQQITNSKLPKAILESMINNPINMAAGASVLSNLDMSELERETPAQLPRRQLNESTPVQQMPMMANAGFDSNYLKFLVKEAVKECMKEIKEELLAENTLKGFKVAGGNKLMMVDSKGNLYEGEMKLKKKAEQN